MRFIGESYGIGWTESGASGITLRATDHHAASALVPLATNRSPDIAKLLEAPLSVQIRSIEYPTITEDEVRHQWKELGLGQYDPPGVDPSTWLHCFDGALELEVAVPEEAFHRLCSELRAYGAAQPPKFYWGHTKTFMLCREMTFREASSEHVEAFFRKGLPISTRSAPTLGFVVGAEKRILDE